MGDEPGNLPLLEFALTNLWEHGATGHLTHSAYEAIGRVEGALARYADEGYAALKSDEQTQARRIFIQLVRPGEGTEDQFLGVRTGLGAEPAYVCSERCGNGFVELADTLLAAR